MLPSTCFLSAASIASENSFPKAPKSDTAMASTPANGPRPTTLIHTSAQISVSTPRIESRNRRTGNRMISGTILRAAIRLTGSAITAATVVPSNAIESVSPSAFRYSGSEEPGSGGSINSVIQPSWCRPLKKRVGEKLRSTRPKMKIAKANSATSGVARRAEAGRSKMCG